jgi:hypothetical protein
MRFGLGWFLVVLFAVAVSRTAAAGDASPATPSVTEADRAAALALVREGNRLLDAHDPAGALDKFRQAHQMVGGDKLRFNLGQALAALPGHELEAYREFERYLDRVRGATPALVKVAREEMQRLRRALGLLRIDVQPAGASIGVDDEAVGAGPLPREVAVAPGAHSLHVGAPGYVAYGESISISAGQERDFLVRLTSSFVPSSLPASVDVVGQGMQSASQDTVALERPPLYRRWWFWAGVGAIVLTGVLVSAAVASGGGVSHLCPPEIASSRCYGAP